MAQVALQPLLAPCSAHSLARLVAQADPRQCRASLLVGSLLLLCVCMNPRLHGMAWLGMACRPSAVSRAAVMEEERLLRAFLVRSSYAAWPAGLCATACLPPARQHLGLSMQAPQEHLQSAAWSLVLLQELQAAQEALPPLRRAQSWAHLLDSRVAREDPQQCQESLQVGAQPPALQEHTAETGRHKLHGRCTLAEGVLAAEGLAREPLL